jgi:hypothetical protein
MQSPSEESTGATLRFVAFLVVSLFVILLAWGRTGIELFVFLGLTLVNMSTPFRTTETA